MKNYYQILGVPASATKDEIKEAYLKLSKKIHPDMNKGDHFFSELFKNINEAHQILIDDEKRNEYNISFNSYLYDFNFMKEKEYSLKKREEQMADKSIRRKVFIRNTVSLLAGIGVVALFSFNLDTPSDTEAIPESSVKLVKPIAIAKPTEPAKPTVASIAKTVATNNTVTPTPTVENKPLLENKPVVKAVENQLAVSTNTTIAKAVEPVVKQEKPSIKKPTNSNKTVYLSDYNMNKIVISIMKERLKRNNTSNVVTLIKYEGSNVENAFKLANVLRSNGFILAGRQTTYRASKGIQVDCNGDIIKVTIGSI